MTSGKKKRVAVVVARWNNFVVRWLLNCYYKSDIYLGLNLYTWKLRILCMEVCEDRLETSLIVCLWERERERESATFEEYKEA